MGINQLAHHRENYLGGSSTRGLQTVDIWTNESGSNSQEKLWVVYIHGGAWRDPAVDSQSFKPAVEILGESALSSSIAGFASINYRLSSYPSHPTNPSSPDDRSRNVVYPFHLLDVTDALLYLEGKYQINNRYVLAGHSAGATMVFELHDYYQPDTSIPQPACVLGISGIYDFNSFVENHSQISAYREIIENAFPSESQWQRASPYTMRLPGLATWETSKAIILAHSDDDELVERGQVELMLERARSVPSAKDKIHFLQATGHHDEIWSSGTILASLITESFGILQATPQEHKSEA